MIDPYERPDEYLAFSIDTRFDADLDELRAQFSSIAKDLELHVRVYENLGLRYVFGVTSHATYERLFGTPVRFVRPRIEAADEDAQLVVPWIEERPSTVPQSLEALVTGVRPASSSAFPVRH